MLQGDFRTMALPDVLQWADASRARGILKVTYPSGGMWLSLADRSVQLLSASPSQPVKLGTGATLVTQRELAIEHFYDQFLFTDGSFHFDGEAAPPDGGVEVDAFLPELLMEGMRLWDEWPRIDKLYPSDSPHLHLGQALLPDSASSLKRDLVSCARSELTLSAARLSVGLSRPAFLRRIEELRSLDYVQVDGTPVGGDLIAKLASQAALLLSAKQYDEAAHVFRALLATDPSAPRVRDLLQRAETEQVETLWAQLPRNSVPAVLRPDVDRGSLTATERTVLDLVNGVWDVGIVVLSSPLREKESLKGLVKLVRLGVLQLRARPPG